ncbi:MAG: Gfo/Idh/MocA family oxidoreductase, partial [Thermomicrobiales bacterium]
PIEYVQAVLRFENGIVAHCAASWAHHAFRTRLEIAGEHGLLRHDSNESLPVRYERDGHVTLGIGDPARPYGIQLRHFIDCLRGDTPFLVEGADGINALAAALAVAESSRTGLPVTLTRETIDGGGSPE